ncbi:ABC transporter ATP-binding protein [Streptomyces genisteinicus]|uniref:ATP-binding cassette domain-containing protein n=1 Tax=Streptomyces genisteinicus TaxID=2768068 RepID=A0A7H0I1G1_9ACTN|nr:ATP-binding cassette domain-containing protein [Streptomyces genisteinicus]QNP66627.1 ATP-binding cassette domain-containing protein [Streptomyces genisteinicus]
MAQDATGARRAGIRRTRWKAPIAVLAGDMWRTDRRNTLVLGLLIALGSVLPATLAVTSGLLAGALLDSGSRSGLDRRTVVVALLLGVVFLLLQTVGPVAQAVAESLGRRLDRSVSQRTMAALGGPADLARVEHPETVGLAAAVDGPLGGGTVRDAVIGTVGIGIARGGAVCGALVLFAYRWWLAVLLLAAYGYAMVVVSRMYQAALESAEGAPAMMRRAMYLKDTLCTPAAAKDVRTFGLADWLLGRYTAEWRSAIARARRDRTGVGRVSLLSGCAVLAVQGLAFLVLARDMANGDLSIGRFTAFAVASTGLLGLSIVTPDLLNIAVGGTMLTSLAELEERTGRPAEHTGDAPARFRTAIVFDGVGFRYPGSDTWVLRDLHMTIPAGTSLAVVGVNGAGKTTLAKLLCGLHRPTEGRILVDGVDMRDIRPDLWARHCAALFQDWIRWSLPLRDNVVLGAPGHPVTPQALERTARSAGLLGLVTELPDGWSTVLSREFGGVDLSGGQWQRVGLARALWALSAGAETLLLDEPSAALDVRGETELYDQLLDAAAGKTVVLISHRFSTVRHADRIVVLDGGAIAEQGGHAALMATNGLYARMFRVQAERFTAGAETQR